MMTRKIFITLAKTTESRSGSVLPGACFHKITSIFTA